MDIGLVEVLDEVGLVQVGEFGPLFLDGGHPLTLEHEVLPDGDEEADGLVGLADTEGGVEEVVVGHWNPFRIVVEGKERLERRVD